MEVHQLLPPQGDSSLSTPKSSDLTTLRQDSSTQSTFRQSNQSSGGGAISAMEQHADGAGFFTQFSATVRRQWIQKRRMPCSMCLEILLPVVFILGLVLASKASSIDIIEGKQFMTAPPSTASQFNSVIRTLVCYNGSLNDPELASLFDPCTGDGTGWVAPASRYLDEAHRIPTGLMFSLMSDVFLFSLFDFQSPWSTISFDYFVALQWATRTLFGPNTKIFANGNNPIQSLQNSGKVFVGPRGTAATDFSEWCNNTYPTWKYVFGGYYDNRASLIDTLVTVSGEGTAWAVLQIDAMSPTSFQVQISTNQSSTPSTLDIRQRFSGGLGSQPYRSYAVGGFLQLQTAVESYYLLSVLNLTPAKVSAMFTNIVEVPMPYGKYKSSAFLMVAGNISPLVLVLAFLYPVSQLAKRIVEEKESRLREGMMIMGLGKLAFFTSWIFNYIAQVLFTTLIVTVVLKLGILTQSDPTVIFCVYLLFGTSTIGLSTLLSSFFSKSRITALVVPLLYFAVSIPSFALPDTTSRGIYVLLSIFSPTAFSLGTRLLFNYEINNGMGWHDVSSPLDEVNMASVLALLLFDTIFYFALTFYLDEILPSEWGTKSHPCFCFCCCCKEKRVELEDTAVGGNTYGAVNDSPKFAMTAGKGNRDAVEDYPASPKGPSVHLRKLLKQFSADGVKKTAVDGFDLKLFEDQVTVILGHNGAGKTTTLNMLTGMLPMTQGDCLVYGNSVRENLRGARSLIGFCPQHNILWDQLTCMEHLQYIGRLKGISSERLEPDAIAMLRRVDLVDKKDVYSGNLSGGQKRKLSVAMAFIGGSKLILLDEPTAGMDAAARRHTWDLVKEMSAGRTIVLTTHFMDEADLLGNRIAIMSKGALHSYGTAMFLKSKLGTGYTMRLSLSKIVSGDIAQSILHRARSVIPSIQLKEHKGQEVALQLPIHESSKFSEVIELMESEEATKDLFVQGISMSVSSLEDVFVKIAVDEEMLGDAVVEDEEVVIEANKASNSNRSSTLSSHRTATTEENNDMCTEQMLPSLPSPKTTSLPAKKEAAVTLDTLGEAFQALDHFYSLLADRQSSAQSSTVAYLTQLKGLLLKRFHNSRRDRRTVVLQIFLPLACIVLAMLLAMIKAPIAPLLWLDTSMYGSPKQQLLSANCGSLLANGINSTPAGVAPYYWTDVGTAQSFAFSNNLLSEFYSHGDFERNIGFSCEDTSLLSVTGQPSTVLFTNASSLHSLPEALGELFGSFARSESGNPSISMRVGNYPLPLSDRQTGNINSFQTLVIGFFVLIPFTFIPSTFVAWVVKERECKAKHLQFVSGVNYFVYWASNYIFDLISYLVTELLAIAVFAIFDRSEYIGGANLAATFTVFFLYGISAIAAAYAVSFFFDNHSSAQNIVMLVNFMCGFVLVITMYILKQISSTKNVADVLVYLFRFVPSYCLGEGILALASAPAIRVLGKDVSVFELNQAGWGMIYMSAEVLLFSVITLLVDHPKRQLRRQQVFFDRNAVPPAVLHEDEDVVAERRIVESNNTAPPRDSDIIRVKNLRKIYGSGSSEKIAVHNLSFGVRQGEVFGFLGTNGAGKTTTMSILTGEFLPTMGSATVSGFDVVEASQQARQVIGYCPQFDALIDLLTPEEHLYLYANLRGVPKDVMSDVVDALLTACALQQYRSLRSKSLSGGNKRKLSVAISLIGGPKVVFLDEPSAGMDPHARRQLWDVILYIAKRSSVVLTTHHLEEVDVLAHRVGIMVDGLMKCVGNLDHLKHKFGDGFEVSLKAKIDDKSHRYSESIERMMKTEFPGSAIVESRQQKLTFCVPFGSTKLSRVFRVLHQAKSDGELGIEDYTVQQTSLEQVFLRISEAEDEAEDPSAGRRSFYLPSEARQ